MNQKEATYEAIVGITGYNGGDACKPTPEQRKRINEVLCAGFRNGSISLEREFTDKELTVYVSGLISNWLRKDKRLNGDVKYVAKNPGSRSGVGDVQLKNLKALLSTVDPEDEAAVTEIQGYIEAREAEIAAAKKPVINVDALPESLRKFVK